MSQLIEIIPLKSSQWSLVGSSTKRLQQSSNLPNVSIHVYLDDTDRLRFVLDVEGSHIAYADNNMMLGYYEKIEHFWAGFLQGCIYEKTRKH